MRPFPLHAVEQRIDDSLHRRAPAVDGVVGEALAHHASQACVMRNVLHQHHALDQAQIIRDDREIEAVQLHARELLDAIGAEDESP
jgi:hypothetical protein